MRSAAAAILNGFLGFHPHVRRKLSAPRKRSNRAAEPGGIRRSRASTQIDSSGLPGLTLATCAEVEGETDPNRNDADSYSAAERERSLQEDSGEWAAEEPRSRSSAHCRRAASREVRRCFAQCRCSCPALALASVG